MQKSANNATAITYLQLYVVSASSYVLAYLLLYLVNGISTLYIAYDMDVPAMLFTGETRFLIPDESPLWSRDAIISVFMTAPLVSFVVGVLALVVYQLFGKMNGPLFFLVIWLFLHGFNMTFGLVTEDLITQTGLTRVAQTLGLHQFALVLTIGVSLYFLFQAGKFTGQLTGIHTPVGMMDSKAKRLKLFASAFFLPWLGGSLFIIGISSENELIKNLILSLFMLFMLSCMFFAKTRIYIKKGSITEVKIWQLLLLPLITAVTIFAVHYLLRDGIALGN